MTGPIPEWEGGEAEKAQTGLDSDPYPHIAPHSFVQLPGLGVMGMSI